MAGKTIVMKFGGTSLDSVEKIGRIVYQIKESFVGNRIAVVVSAIGKTTNQIIEDIGRAEESGYEPRVSFGEYLGIYGKYGKEVVNIFRNTRREYIHTFREIEFFPNLEDPSEVTDSSHKDFLLVTGERLSAPLMAAALNTEGLAAKSVDFFNDMFPLVVKGEYQNADVNLEKTRQKCEAVVDELDKNILVFPGFGGVDYGGNGKHGRVKTLGRGGSDNAAFGYAYGLKADEVWIGTDVEGIKQALVNGASTVPQLGIEEAKAAAFYGAKLPSKETLKPLEKMYKESLSPKVFITHSQNLLGPKTEIMAKTEAMDIVKVIAARNVNRYEISADDATINELVEELRKGRVEYYNFGQGLGELRLGLIGKGLEVGERIVSNYERNRMVQIRERKKDVPLVGVIGCGMAETPGVSARFDEALKKDNINISDRFDFSEVSMGVFIKKEDREKAIQSLFNEWFNKA